MGADTLFKLGIVTITELAKDTRDMAAMPELKLATTMPKADKCVEDGFRRELKPCLAPAQADEPYRATQARSVN